MQSQQSEHEMGPFRWSSTHLTFSVRRRVDVFVLGTREPAGTDPGKVSVGGGAGLAVGAGSAGSLVELEVVDSVRGS